MGYKLNRTQVQLNVLKKQAHLLKVEVQEEITYLQNNLQKEKDTIEG